MSQRVALSPEHIVRTAIEFVDQNGIEALSLRKLGDKLNAHFTSVYRHFASREDLLSAMFSSVISEVAQAVDLDSADPKTRIRAIAIAFRAAMHKHPGLVGTIVSTSGTEATFAIQRQIAQDMLELGVPQDQVAMRYQALESYVFGAAMFDYLGAPGHLEDRVQRFTKVRDGIFDAAASGQDQIDAHNEKAFIFGLDAILAAIANS